MDVQTYGSDNSVNALNKSINELISIIKSAESDLSEESNEPLMQKLAQINDTVKQISDQNEKIAKGIVVIADMIKEEMPKLRHPPAPMHQPPHPAHHKVPRPRPRQRMPPRPPIAQPMYQERARPMPRRPHHEPHQMPPRPHHEPHPMPPPHYNHEIRPRAPHPPHPSPGFAPRPHQDAEMHMPPPPGEPSLEDLGFGKKPEKKGLFDKILKR